MKSPAGRRLWKLMDEVARASSLEQVYQSVLSCLESALDVDRSSILVLDERGVMRFAAWKGLSAAYRRAVEGHSPWAPDDKEAAPVLVPDVSQAEELASYRDLFTREQIAALAFIPLQFGDKLLGKFMLYYREPHAFSEDEVAVARAIAGHIAFALEHRRIAAALRASHEELRKHLESEREARRRAEEEAALRRAIEDSVLAGVAAVDASGAQTYVNPAFCAMVGWSKEELVGARPPFVYWPAEERDRIEAALRRTTRGETPPEGFELRFQRRSGERFDVLVLVSPLREASDRTPGWLASVYDISERKRAEERLRVSEDRLRTALEAGRLGAWDWSVNEERVVWSRELEAIHGLPAGGFDGSFEAFQRDIHPEDRERVLSTIRDTLERRSEKYEIEYRIRRPDGEVRWLEARGRLISNETRAPVRMVGVCSDVTERKRLEQGREFLADAAGVLSSSLDPEETLKSLARLAVPRLADWCAVHLAGEDGGIATVEVVHSDPAKIELVWSVLRNWPLSPEAGPVRVIRTGQPLLRARLTPEQIAAAVQSPERPSFLDDLGLYSSMVVPLKARGRTLGAISLVSAESKREYGPEDLGLAEQLASRAALAIDNARLFVEAEDARRAAERAASRLRVLAEASHALASALDDETALKELALFAVSTIADYCITYSREADGTIRRVGLAHRNPAMQSLVEDLVRAGPPTIEDAYGAGAVVRTGESVLAAEIPKELLERAAQNPKHLAVLEKLVPRSSIIVPLRARGRIFGAFALATTDDMGRRYTKDDLILAEDLADRVALLVDNARLYRQAQEAVGARDDLMAVVSHDLKNPLYTILLSCAVLDLDPPPEKRWNSLAVIRRSAKQMERLIEDLLDVARIEAGGLALHPQPVEIASVISEARTTFLPLAEEKSVELFTAIEPGLPAARADRERLLQALSNLLSNAMKFVPEGGRVELGAERMEGAVRISVSDSGPGIPEEQIPFVFDRFWQADAKNRQGAGLGLAIAKGIIEAHGGVIRVESRAGKGTTFFFSVPAEETAPVLKQERMAREKR